MLLAGDIGGTKTTLAVFSEQRGPRAPLAEETFHSAEFPSLEAIIERFLGGTDYQIERASFGVAGPVVDGEARITNLPWVIRRASLGDALHCGHVALLNDLVAIASGVPHLEPGDRSTLNEGRPERGGTLAVIAPGTGLGEAFLIWDGARYRAYASEGGHADFAPTDSTELELLRYLMARLDHVSYERVCSGKGLPNIYAFLKETGRAEEPAWLAERLAAAADPSPVITEAALHAESPSAICLETMRLFVSIMGAEAGNLALKVLPSGGVYLGGGIPPRLLSLLREERFMRAFTHKGRLSQVLEPLPVHVILNPKIALLGAAYHGLMMLDS